MIHKQSVFLLCLLAPFLVAMEQPEMFSTKDEDEVYSEIKVLPKKEEYFEGKSVEELNTVFEYAPWKAQEIVDHLQNPDALKQPGYRAAFFVGKPGVGKTTTALAIAYALKKHNWEHKFVRCANKLRSFRNRTAEELQNRFKEIKKRIKENRKLKIIYIADELHLLLCHANDPHYDNDATGAIIQGFLDGMKGEHNFFFIGTMNNDTDMPVTFKNRIELSRIVFPPITNQVSKRNIFRNKMVTPHMQLHQECDDKFIDEIINKLGNCPPRSYDNMREELSRMLYHEAKNRENLASIWNMLPDALQTAPDQNHYIKKQHLIEVTNALLAARKDMKIDEEEETEAQRQERHFVQQQLIQLERVEHEKTVYEYDTSVSGNISVGMGSIGGGIGTNQKVVSTRQQLDRLGAENVLSLFTEEQTKILQKIAANMSLRRAEMAENSAKEFINSLSGNLKKTISEDTLKEMVINEVVHNFIDQLGEDA